MCARFELEHGQPRTKLGLAAGFVVLALAGCATPSANEATLEPSFIEPEHRSAASGGEVTGVVRDRSGTPVANATVSLHSSSAPAQQRQRMTDERGGFSFEQLPPGTYSIQVLVDKANVTKIFELQQDARLRTNFSVDLDDTNINVIDVRRENVNVVVGMLVEQ